MKSEVDLHLHQKITVLYSEGDVFDSISMFHQVLPYLWLDKARVYLLSLKKVSFQDLYIYQAQKCMLQDK